MSVPSGLDRVRQVAVKDKQVRFTALLHHVDVDRLRAAYWALNPKAATTCFDLWADRWRRRHARGDVVIVRYADDYVVGFQHEGDARRFLADLRDRLAKFSLELAAEKTRLIQFGRYAVERRQKRGLGRPETQGQAGARCRRCRRSVSPTCPPNRTCPFLCIRLSTGHLVADS